MLEHKRRISHRLGRRGERLAMTFLRESGCEILARNYVAKHGEIDVVARDGEVIVFVEVKTRRKVVRSRPGEAVGRLKKQHLIRSAHQYLREIGFPKIRYRFDIVEIVMRGIILHEIVYYPNAFSQDFDDASISLPQVY